jgi:hypothetical protein
MKTPATLILTVCLSAAFGQTPGNFHVFLTKSEVSDTGMTIVEISTLVKISDYKPETVLIPKNYNLGYSVDSRPRKFYYQPKGEMSFLVYPRRNLLANLQPHIVLNVVGLSTYLSSRFGFGITNRKYGISTGFLYGNYLRRLDSNADVTFRGKVFEDSHTFGGYVSVDKKYGSFLFLLMKETSFSYHDLEIKLRLESFINCRYVPTNLNLEFKSITFLGTGLGLSYTTPNQHTT